MKIRGVECEVHPEAPAPLPFRKFMTYIGPAMMSIALGLGTSELILYPRLTAEFGTGLLQLWAVTGNTSYRDAAVAIGDVLASRVRGGDDPPRSAATGRTSRQGGRPLGHRQEHALAQDEKTPDLVPLRLPPMASAGPRHGP